MFLIMGDAGFTSLKPRLLNPKTLNPKTLNHKRGFLKRFRIMGNRISLDLRLCDGSGCGSASEGYLLGSSS